MPEPGQPISTPHALFGPGRRVDRPASDGSSFQEPAKGRIYCGAMSVVRNRASPLVRDKPGAAALTAPSDRSMWAESWRDDMSRNTDAAPNATTMANTARIATNRVRTAMTPSSGEERLLLDRARSTLSWKGAPASSAGIDAPLPTLFSIHKNPGKVKPVAKRVRAWTRVNGQAAGTWRLRRPGTGPRERALSEWLRFPGSPVIPGTAA
jgi:hypothetical protein